MRAWTLLLLLVSTSIPQALQAAPPPAREVSSHGAALLERAHPDALAPGTAILVARGDQVLLREARGKASLELGVDLAPDHVFRLASVTKQFAAAGVLRLASEGKLSLQDPLEKFVPGYPGGDAITVQMLLNHTSGVRSYTDMPGVMEGPIQKTVTTAQLVEYFRDEKPDFAPGQGWHYNNSGYVLVGAVIEAASGLPWHEYLRQAFFEPLGMDDTGLGDEAARVIPGLVRGYTRNGESWAASRYLSMTQPHAAGALASSLDDLLTWNRALHGGKLIDPALYQQMVTPTGPAQGNGYGFGIVRGTLRGETLLQHGGGIFGFSTYLLYLPGHDLTVAVLGNADQVLPGGLGASTLAHTLAAHAIGKPYPAKHPIEVDEATLRGYEGVYRIDRQSARTLRVVDGKLTSQRTGSQPFALLPVARDQFLFEDGFSRMAFERDAQGRVEAMRFFPEDEGEGEVVARTDEPLPAARAAIELPPAATSRLVGRYVREGMAMEVASAGAGLTAQLQGQPAFEIFAESPTRFFLKVVEAELQFSAGEGPAGTVTLHQGGRELEFTRSP